MIDGEATDAELVRRLRAGDEAAFAAIVGRYRRRLEAHARRTLAGRGHDAEDVVQEAFVRAYRALKRDERDMALGSWLHCIVRNCALDVRRRDAGWSFEEHRQADSSPIDEVQQREALAAVLGAVAALPQRQRDALVLRVIHGRPYTWIAEELDTSLPAVKGLIARARRTLRAA
jgi:RNA polymerase sigma-70 factor (ECF subfamily)